MEHSNAPQNISEIKKHVIEDKNIVNYSVEQMEYIQKPIGKANYNAETKKKAHWSDRIKCEICGKEFTRSARTKHNQTQHHQTYANLNKKLASLLLGKSAK